MVNCMILLHVKCARINLAVGSEKMDKKYGLTSTEYEIMELFWDTDGKLSFKEVMEYFNSTKNKNWKKQTVSTFLKILQDKGLIASDTSGKKYQYYATCTREKHINMWVRQMMKDSFDNSMGQFLMAFSGGEKLSEKDAEELREYLKKYE
ncbi:BlaI family transcriptional regulator, penicillinase repressor [Marvinbryantia formatexigens]|nr:BlaI family transcriptional regulator, penicillinase repressor [Marvinbryantia formatexigens]